jgi:hypothetical protein
VSKTNYIYPIHIQHGETLEHFLSQFKKRTKESDNTVIPWDYILKEQFESANLRENSAGEKFLTLPAQVEIDE